MILKLVIFGIGSILWFVVGITALVIERPYFIKEIEALPSEEGKQTPEDVQAAKEAIFLMLLHGGPLAAAVMLFIYSKYLIRKLLWK